MEGSAVVGGLAKSFVVYLHTCVERTEAIKLKKVDWTIFMSQKPFVVRNILVYAAHCHPRCDTCIFNKCFGEAIGFIEFSVWVY